MMAYSSMSLEYLFPAGLDLCLEHGVFGGYIILGIPKLFFQYGVQFFDFGEGFFTEKDFQFYFCLHFAYQVFQSQPDCLK